MAKFTFTDWMRESLAEIIGTFLLLSFGTGCVAQAVLSRKEDGTMLSINLGWGAGVVLGIMASAATSGAHLNPAVSVSLAVVGKFPWRKVPHYIISQYIGAFLGAGVTLLTYRESILNYSEGSLQVLGEQGTAGIFVTFPRDGVSNIGGGIDQVVGTMLLLMCVSAIGLPCNKEVSRTLGPLLVGITVVAIGACFGHNAGYAINPARDLSPRVLLALSGWGTEVFTAKDHWFWIPVVCSHLGGILGAILVFFGLEWPQRVGKVCCETVSMEEKQNLSV